MSAKYDAINVTTWYQMKVLEFINSGQSLKLKIL